MNLLKKDKDNPFYSIKLKALQDIINQFQTTGLNPTKARIDHAINFLQSRIGKDAKNN